MNSQADHILELPVLPHPQIEAVRAELPPEIASGIEAVAELFSESEVSIKQRQALLEQFEPQNPAAWIAKCLDVLRAKAPEVQT